MQSWSNTSITPVEQYRYKNHPKITEVGARAPRVKTSERPRAIRNSSLK